MWEYLVVKFLIKIFMSFYELLISFKMLLIWDCKNSGWSFLELSATVPFEDLDHCIQSDKATNEPG